MAESFTTVLKLVPALRRGERDAYRQLVRSMGEPLQRYAATITGDYDLAADVVQEALIVIYRRRNRLDSASEFRGLCFRTVRNLARNAVRDNSLRKRREQEASEMRGANEKPALAAAAWELAKKLPDALREVIELRFSFGLNRKEVADALDIPEGTVATRQRSALKTLREQLNASAMGPGLALPAIGKLLGMPQPPAPSPNLTTMEELVMKGIARTQLKAGLTLAGTALAVLLLLTGGGVLVHAITAPAADNQTVIATVPASSARKPRHVNTHIQPADTDPAKTAEPAATKPESAGNEPAAREKPQPGPSQQPVKDPVLPNNGKPDPMQPEAKPEPKPQAQPKPQPAAPRFITQPADTAVAGKEYSYRPEVSGTPTPTLTALLLPNWLQLDNGVVHGTPLAVNTGDKASVILTAKNGVAPAAEQRFVISVQSAPKFKSTPPSDAVADKLYTYNVKMEGDPKPTLKLENAPAWLELNNDVISGKPDRHDGGKTGKIKLVASNGVNPDAVQTWTITVNCPPVFESSPVLKAKAGERYEYKIKVSGTPEPSLDASRLPGWLKLENGKLTGMPRIKDVGKSRKITLKASNGAKPGAKQSFKITVEENPNYVEMPWSIEDAKKIVKVGLKWTTREYVATADIRGKEELPRYKAKAPDTFEVTAVDKDGFTVQYPESGPKIKFRWGESLLAPIWPNLTHPKRSTETIVVMGKKLQCVVYTFKQKFDGGNKTVYNTYKFWFCKDYPFVPVRRSRHEPAAVKGNSGWQEVSHDLETVTHP